jgi:hypothetical protein
MEQRRMCTLNYITGLDQIAINQVPFSASIVKCSSGKILSVAGEMWNRWVGVSKTCGNAMLSMSVVYVDIF